MAGLTTVGTGREPIRSAYLTWATGGNTDGALSSLAFDVVKVESHTRAAEVTDHTVEQGVAIVDHVRPNPDTVSLSVFVSNTPIVSDEASFLPLTLDLPRPAALDSGDPSAQLAARTGGYQSTATAQALQFNGDTDFVARTYNTLTTLRNTATLIELHTPRAFYTNMVIKSIAMRRESRTGTGADFELEFRQIRVVSSRIVQAPLPTVPRAAPVVNQGKKDAKKPEDEESLFHALRAFINRPAAPAATP